IVRSEEELSTAYPSARNEAKNAFGNDEIYLEKYLTNPRHIEFQIAGDKYGNIVCHGERDCSIQRRNQKLIEEAPCSALDDDLRRTMGETAVKVAGLVNYDSVGTVEFLLDKRGDFYFIEMNTRIQVEHPVTEIVTGVDLVQEQIAIAAGKRLDPTKAAFNCIKAHAIECRICAEDPSREFAPCSGVISNLLLPGGPGVRVDTALYEGCRVSPHYDSLLAKLIVWGPTRDKAIKIADRALGEFTIGGIPTTISFHRKVITDEKFVSGKTGTNFIDSLLKPDPV
ncbi:MAG TPA: acetyl-CoA carboxylase biotin carboxylase subunit, partial [Clostridia bacterium]|nr:acetyl-CoA carboxylase biotin carboxylase subunit [Clostridia bacterium]